jgi:hypothetical protein
MDNELAFSEKSSVAVHLEACSACRSEYESLLYSYRLTDRLPLIEVRSDSWELIADRVQNLSAGSVWRRLLELATLRPWVPVGAAVLLLLAVSLVMFPTQSRSPQMQRVLQDYIQEREQDFYRKGVLMGPGRPGVTLVGYNPFAEKPHEINGNPFKAE